MPGEIVTAQYKTGKYIGEKLEVNEQNVTTLIKVLAVLKHPTQGDLHNPNQTDVPLFHQRKALAQFEKAWMPSHTVKPFQEEEIPDYKKSLQEALSNQIKELKSKDTEWTKKSLLLLEELEKEYSQQWGI